MGAADFCLILQVRLRVLVAAVENSISGDAFRPGDVLTARNGKTTEIGNTDAEGRLVLADALVDGWQRILGFCVEGLWLRPADQVSVRGVLRAEEVGVGEQGEPARTTAE